MLPMAAVTDEQRKNQHLADVAQEEVERPATGETAVDPNAPENRERWKTPHVNNHESVFSFSDNLTTLMFIVASDLSEAQRERLTSSLSLREMDVRTFENVRTVFGDLFCTQKSSMENPSLRVSGHVNSMNRTCIVGGLR